MTKAKGQGGLGFRDFQCYNDAFLAKLSWRLLHNPSCLLGRVLLGKYCIDEDFMEVTDRSSESHGWRGILIGRNLLKAHLGWAVGTGESINVWNDDWLSVSEKARPMGPAPANQETLTVADLMLPNRSDWNRELLQHLFPFEEDRILLIKPSRTGAPDKRIWLKTKDGIYSVKSGYWAACDLLTAHTSPPMQPLDNFDWDKGIWKLNLAPKIKLFLWKLCCNALPVGECLAARNIPINAKCSRCESSESINHLFFHCDFAQKVWDLAPLSATFDARGWIDLNESWNALLLNVCLPPVGITTGNLAP